MEWDRQPAHSQEFDNEIAVNSFTKDREVVSEGTILRVAVILSNLLAMQEVEEEMTY